MPTYMIGTYNEDNTVDVMMMAWGGICAEDMVALNLEAEHKTVANLETRKAFTLAVPGTDTLRESDFLGIASSNKMEDKFERTGYHAVKSAFVNAPIIEEFPVVMECELAEVSSTESFYAIVGKIVNTAAEESVLSANGKVDPEKLEALIFDQFQHGYYVSGERVGKAWNAGAGWMKKC